jgi:uncharacterized membrane protein
MNTESAPTTHAYLEELRRVVADLPPAVAAEIVRGVEEALSGLTDDEAQVRIAELGDPHEIAADVRDESPVNDAEDGDRHDRGWYTWLTAVLILLGGVLFPVVGWIVGVVLLWRSRSWRLRDKLVGTLLPPTGGFAAVVALTTPYFDTTSGISPTVAPIAADAPDLVALLIVLSVLPFVTFLYLLLSARHLKKFD